MKLTSAAVRWAAGIAMAKWGRGRRLMNTERAQVGWGFWLWWVLASTVGLAVAFAMGVAVLEAVGEAVGFAMAFAVGGAITGVVLV